MDKKWILISSLSVLLLFSFGTASSQQLNQDSERLNAVMSIVTGFLLDSEQQNNTQFQIGQAVNFDVPGINLNSVVDCEASPQLPNGLSLQVNDEQTGCEIVGTPSAAAGSTLITVTATNSTGIEASSELLLAIEGAPTISGVITYERVPVSLVIGLDFDNTRQLPVRGATVELLDANGAILQTANTNDQGQYSFDVSSNELRRVRVKAQLIQVSQTAANYNVVVVDNTNSDALYALTEAQASTAAANPVRNLNASSGFNTVTDTYTGTRAAAPFAILDSIYSAMIDIISIDPDVVFPPLTVNWSINNSISGPLTGELIDQARAAGRIGSSFYVPSSLAGFDINAGELFLLGAFDSDSDEFDQHVVIHEWGHYFEDRLSRSDSIGGSHGAGDLLDLRVAFSEGFSNAFSAMITDDSVYADSFTFFGLGFTFSFDVEDNDVENPGWFSEASVQSLLFDLYDTDNDGSDTLSVGLQGIYNAMISPGHAGTDAFTSIFSFSDSFLNSQSSSVGNVFEDLLESQSIESVFLDQFGSPFERNFGGLSIFDFRDVYGAVTLTANSPDLTFADLVVDTVCTTTEFIEDDGQTNKLFNSAFVQVNIPTAGQYTVAVIEDSFSTDYDGTVPTALIYKDGEFLGGANSISGTLLAFNVVLTEPGTHIIEVFDNNIESDVGFTGTACFSVGVVAP